MSTVYTLAELSTLVDTLNSKQNGQATQIKEVVANLQTQLITLIKEVRELTAGSGSPTPSELEAEIVSLTKKVSSQATQIKEVTSSVQSQILKIAKETTPDIPIDIEEEISDLRSTMSSQGIKIKEVTSSVQSQIIKIAKEIVPATISVGSTTTGIPGTSATVTNTGNHSAVILNFTIPQGDPGPPGTTALSGLSDITLNSPSAGQILGYNGTDWTNVKPGITLEMAAALAIAL